MRIAVIGGGPGGLYFSALAQQLAEQLGDGAHEITVWERNAADDTFGFGVVFSDETLGGIEHADPAVYAQMEREFAVWDDIDVHFKGEVVTSGGHGFAAMSRRRLLEILQARCAALDVDVRFRTEAPDVAELAASYDLVIAADGLNSAVRTRFADTFRPTLDVRDCRYMWLGTDKVFEAFKFYVAQTPYGVMQIHGYPFDATGSTFIVEMTSAVWEAAGFAANADREWAPGESDHKSIDQIRELFADVLDGHEVLANNSRWISFTTIRNEHWVHDNVVLLGDSAHTAHFSIGSGTKLAMEDALTLAACLHEEASVPTALAAYEEERKAVVLSTQRAAQASLEWFENLAQYVDQEPLQFGFNIMTRSRRVTYDNLRVRDPEFVSRCEKWFSTSTVEPVETNPAVEPVETNPTVEPVETNPTVEPVETNPTVEPVETNPTVEPVETNPTVEPVETNPTVEPVETNPTVEPVETNPTVEPVETNPTVEPVETNPTVEPVETNPTVEPVETPPMFQPFTLGGLTLPNRIVVSPMDMYVAEDGLVGDFHLVHLGGKALGGAGLVMTEMVCVSPTGRITPGCAGIWDDEQQAAWARVVDFVHASSPAKLGLQLGHSGAKGSTKLMWEGIDEPLPDGSWDVVAASPVSYNPAVNQVPHELTHEELDEIREQFVDCARRGAAAGFDLLELHCAHGYLLSGFLSPVTNKRTDEYGGEVEGRLRWPLEVFTAMREASGRTTGR